MTTTLGQSLLCLGSCSGGPVRSWLLQGEMLYLGGSLYHRILSSCLSVDAGLTLQLFWSYDPSINHFFVKYAMLLKHPPPTHTPLTTTQMFSVVSKSRERKHGLPSTTTPVSSCLWLHVHILLHVDLTSQRPTCHILFTLLIFWKVEVSFCS